MKKIISSILVFTLISVPASGAFATQSTEGQPEVISLTDKAQQNVPSVKKTENKTSIAKNIFVVLGSLVLLVDLSYQTFKDFFYNSSVKNIAEDTSNFSNNALEKVAEDDIANFFNNDTQPVNQENTLSPQCNDLFENCLKDNFIYKTYAKRPYNLFEVVDFAKTFTFCFINKENCTEQDKKTKFFEETSNPFFNFYRCFDNLIENNKPVLDENGEPLSICTDKDCSLLKYSTLFKEEKLKQDFKDYLPSDEFMKLLAKCCIETIAQLSEQDLSNKTYIIETLNSKLSSYLEQPNMQDMQKDYEHFKNLFSDDQIINDFILNSIDL